MGKKKKHPAMPDWENPDLVPGIGLMNFLTITVDLKENPGFYMLIDLHGSERYGDPHWYLVAKDTKERLGVITYNCKWEKGRRPRVAPEVRLEAESLTRKYAPTIVDYFDNGFTENIDPY